MARFSLLVLFFASVHAVLGVSLRKRISDGDFFNVTDGGGSWLDSGNGTLGEPLNVVISSLSSEQVLTDDGFLNFAQAIGFSTECLGIHLGSPQSANLGDGNGNVNQTTELRENYPIGGTCEESLVGGNHLRMFRQSGSEHNTGALFLAVSKEETVFQSHDIASDGYDVGRDSLVASALNNPSYGSVSYTVTAQNLTGYLTAGNGTNHGIAIDGVVKLLTVTATGSLSAPAALSGALPHLGAPPCMASINFWTLVGLVLVQCLCFSLF
ncbi:hypothetical protein F5888DRAFT_113617 [Russula emetica]|nr:hypothetical protein F5888DRAFT_113617 [Russula emetica]